MNDSRIIFIGGIHGVGKGEICKELCEGSSIEYLSASKLIKWEEVSPDIKNKKVIDIPSTQKRLINALEIICKKGKTYLLDGHYCLLDSESKINRVSEEIFSLISPKLLVLVSADSEVVVERLKNRDARIYKQNLIEKMAEHELEYFHELSETLRVEQFHATPKNKNEIIGLLKARL